MLPAYMFIGYFFRMGQDAPLQEIIVAVFLKVIYGFLAPFIVCGHKITSRNIMQDTAE
jgi:hypothetical protein